MNDSQDHPLDPALRAAASRWQVARDRGLSASESIDFELWLSADPRHAAAMRAMESAWQRLDRIPDRLAQRVLADAARQRRYKRWSRISGGLATAAAAIAAALLFVFQSNPPSAAEAGRASAEASAPTAVLQATGPRILTLADGTEAWLNADTEITERFTPSERRVRLVRGEAYFSVTKDPSRPFLVEAGPLRVRAVGTAFNVNLSAAHSEVLVLEGRVAVSASAETKTGTDAVQSNIPPPTRDSQETAELQAGERATLTNASLASESASDATAAKPALTLTVSRVGVTEIDRALAWQDRLLRLGGQTLAEIAAEFGRRTGHRVVFVEPGLAQLRLGGRFRADDVEGFAALLASMLDVELEPSENGTLVLRKKK